MVLNLFTNLKYVQSYLQNDIIMMLIISPTVLSNWTEEVIDNQEADPLGDTHNQLLQ